MNPGDEGPVFASVTFEEVIIFLTARQPVLRFGRSRTCEVTFGDQASEDTGLPLVAGQVSVVGAGRVAVENLSDRLAIDVRCDDVAVEVIRPGVLLSPCTRVFDAVIHGAQRAWVLHIAVLHPSPHMPVIPSGLLSDEVTVRSEPVLSPRQWQVLAAYTAPIRAGRPVPATHAQVAEVLGWSMALIRLECSEIWNRLALAGIPMRDFPAKRDAIVDAAVRHRLEP